MSQEQFENLRKLIAGGGNEQEIKGGITREILQMKSETGLTLLHWAARYGRSSLIPEFVNMGADIDGQTDAGWTPIHWAAYQGHVDTIETLLKQGARLDVVSNAGWTPIHWAAYQGHVDTIETLLKQGARLDVVDKAGQTPQKLAEILGKTAAADFLRHANSRTPEEIKLFESAKHDDVCEFQKIFTNEFHLFIVNKLNGVNLYKTIKLNNCIKIMNYLRSRQVTETEYENYRQLLQEKDPEIVEANEQNPLFDCFVNFYLLKFETQICAKFANIDTALNFKSPLQLALDYGSRLLVGEILRYVILEDEALRNIWFLNKEYQKSTEEIIKTRQNSLKKKQKKNYKPIHVAIFDDCSGVIDYMLQNRFCLIDEGIEDVGPPIFHAAKKGRKKCVETLSKYNPNMEYIDKFGQTLLHLAIRNNLKEQYEFFLNNISGVRHKDEIGLTALHWAVIKKDEEMIKMLIGRDDEWNETTNINVAPMSSNLLTYNEISCDLLKSITTRENALTICVKANNFIYDFLLDKPVDVMLRDGNENTLLHLLSQRYLVNECGVVIGLEKNCLNIRNRYGRTAIMDLIEVALEKMKGNVMQQLLDTVEMLIPEDANQSQIEHKYPNDISLIQTALQVEDERLLLSMTKHHPILKIFTEADISYCIDKQYFTFIDKSIDTFDNKTYFKVMLPNRFINLINIAPYECLSKLYAYADDIYKPLMVENLMRVCYENGDLNAFNDRINVDVEQPQLLLDGESLLTFMIRRNELEICENLISKRHSENLVEKRNQDGDLPIHLCAKLKQYDLIQSLLPYTNDVDEIDSNGETVLSILLQNLAAEDKESDKWAVVRAVRVLVKNGGDIYKVNTNNGRSAVSFCRNDKWKTMIERFNQSLNKGKKVDIGDPEGASSNADEGDPNECKICFNDRIDCELQCGHRLCCECGFRIDECPYCRKFPTNPRKLTDDEQ